MLGWGAVVLNLWCFGTGAAAAQAHRQEVLGAPVLQRSTCYWVHPTVSGLPFRRQTTSSSVAAVDARLTVLKSTPTPCLPS
jgi:hypothetical protein